MICAGVVGVVAESGQDLDRRNTVSHAVVELEQDRPPIVLEALDYPAFPERTVQVEGAFQGVCDGPKQFRFVARPGQRRPLDVRVKIEFGLVDPLRPQHLRVPGDSPKPLCQSRFEKFEVGNGAVDHGDCADCQACVPVRFLGPAQASVQCRQLCYHKSPPVSL